jgi:hypothetical protein
VEQPGTSLLAVMPYLQHIIAAAGEDQTRFKRLLLGDALINGLGLAFLCVCM